MRLRALSIVAILLTIAGVAGAQQPPKKKKPKKPKTEQPADPPDDGDQPASLLRKDDDPAPSQDPPDRPPPKIDTNLKEAEPTNPGTNPWLVSGVAKRRDGGGAPVPASDSHQEQKKPIDTTGSKPVAITAQGGYASNNLRIGVGGKIGYELLQAIYIGAGFVYHLGTSIGPVTVSAFYPSGELGYSFHFENVTIRPYAGFGMLFFRTVGGQSTVSNGAQSFFTVYPGAQLDYQVPDNPVFIGVDGRALFVFGANDYGQSIGVFGVAGVRL